MSYLKSSVSEFAREFQASFTSLHGLVNNAGDIRPSLNDENVAQDLYSIDKTQQHT